MVIPGHVQNGVIVLDDGGALPEGAAVVVSMPESTAAKTPVGQQRINVPLVRTGKPGTVNLTSESIAAILADADAATSSLAEVKHLTQSIYGQGFTVEEREDREIPDDRHFVFRVIDFGEDAAILARNDRWHRELLKIPAAVRGMFRLSIDTAD